MTSSKCNFLIVHYNSVDFLFNRNQITASVSNIESKSISTGINYVTEVINYGSKKLLSINMDGFLRNIFKIDDEPYVKLSVITDINAFSRLNTEKIREIIDSENIECDKNYISFSLTSRSEIRKIDISALKLIPKTFRGFYNHYGILGCHFPVSDRIQYFADIENLFFNSLLKGKTAI